MKINRPLIILLLLYYFLSIFTYIYWHKTNWNPVTGDEPHYLVIADSIVHNLSLELTSAYQKEFNTRKIYQFGLAPINSIPSTLNTQTVSGSHGLYSSHNIGLPIFISLPFLFGGTHMVKIFLVFVSGLILILVWKISVIFTNNKYLIIFITILLCFGLPFIPATNQVYPDLLAGIICLFLLYHLMTININRTMLFYLFTALSLAFLPWLQIKNIAPAFILLFSTVLSFWKINPKRLKVCWVFLLVFSASMLTLTFYNKFAFGNYFGPYDSNSLNFSKTALMTLVGLQIDQNQGFFIQNPVYLIGVYYLLTFIKKYRYISFITFLVYLSFLIPNALHPNWYGGGSFSGRFALSATLVFIVPTIFGLTKLYKNNKNIFFLFIFLLVLLQLYLYYCYSFNSSNLYNRGQNVWVEFYSIYYGKLSSILPSFFNSDWAFTFKRNLIYICLFLILFFLKKIFLIKKGYLFVILSLLVTFITTILFIFDKVPHQTLEWSAAMLPNQTGTLIGSNRETRTSIDNPGFITFGPYIRLNSGSYELKINYVSNTVHAEKIGYVEIFDHINNDTIGKFDIFGSDNTNKTLMVPFSVKKNTKIGNYQFRNYWNGNGNITLHSIELKVN